MRAIPVVCTVAVLAVISTSPAAALDRPCGGPLTSLFIPQGFAGADFRPACRFHDDCYAIPGASRLGCDLAYRDMMFAQCQCSRFPMLCRVRANNYFLAARLLGGPGYRASQRGLYPPGSASLGYASDLHPDYRYPAISSSCSRPVADSTPSTYSAPLTTATPVPRTTATPVPRSAASSAPRIPPAAATSATRAIAHGTVRSSRPAPANVPTKTPTARQTTQRIPPMPINAFGW